MRDHWPDGAGNRALKTFVEANGAKASSDLRSVTSQRQWGMGQTTVRWILAPIGMGVSGTINWRRATKALPWLS